MTRRSSARGSSPLGLWSLSRARGARPGSPPPLTRRCSRKTPSGLSGCPAIWGPALGSSCMLIPHRSLAIAPPPSRARILWCSTRRFLVGRPLHSLSNSTAPDRQHSPSTGAPVPSPTCKTQTRHRGAPEHECSRLGRRCKVFDDGRHASREVAISDKRQPRYERGHVSRV
jgi:hypothetical protein